VLLHEGLGCVALWRDFPEVLAEATGCGVLAFSRFGYGGSDPVTLPRPMSYMHDEARQVLPAVLDAAGVRRAVLIGHSDGGSIAAIHAGEVRDPRAEGVVMMAAHFFVEDMNIAAIRSIRATYERGDMRQRLARYHRDVDVAFYGWNDAWLDPRFRAFDITDQVARIRVPVLALQGTDDPYGTEEQLHVLRRTATCPVETRLIANAHHAPHLEARQATLDALVPFVRSVLLEATA
jgi:pimeloyl-ACP methyl ester carboxylesterase